MSGNPYDQFDTVNPYDQFDHKSVASYDSLGNGQLAPTGSPDAIAARSPVGSFLQNSIAGMGKTYTDAMLGGRQILNQIGALSPTNTLSSLVTGQKPLEQEAVNKREIDAPLNKTWGGNVGQIAAGVPLSFLPGANTYTGAALIGGGMGALQPTVGNESRLLNTGVGTGIGVAGKFAGDALSSWLTRRAAEPFMGWNPTTANRAAAQAIGGAESLAPTAEMNPIGEANSRISGIFTQARSPDMNAEVGENTLNAVVNAGKSLNKSTRTAFEANSEISDLMDHAANGTATAEQLGHISSRLGAEGRTQMTSKDGDRALGRALFAVQEHADDLVGSTIKDPQLANAYSTARGQYRSLNQITANPTIFNSASGDVNMTALGKYLQRTDKPGYLRGGNQSDLYNAARWGQVTGEGRGAPPLELGNFGLPWLKYQALNNPMTQAAGGAASRLGAPIAPQLGSGLQGLAFGSTPIALSYLEE